MALSAALLRSGTVRMFVFVEGQHAFESGMSRADNPYGVINERAHCTWDEGWLAAYERTVGKLAGQNPLLPSG